jgi:hypothetical protein
VSEENRFSKGVSGKAFQKKRFRETVSEKPFQQRDRSMVGF